MKKTPLTRLIPACALILSMVASLLLSACAGNKKEPVLPPIRMSEYPADGSFAYIPESLNEAVSDSDAVAKVRIGDWLGDSGSGMNTLFSAEVVETVKGELPAKFTLLQDGSSEFTFRNDPLFTAGNELLLFLKKTSDEGKKLYNLPEDTYKITYSTLTAFDIVTMNGSEEYAFPRSSWLLETMPGTVRNYAQDETFLKNAVDALIRSDSVWKQIDTAHEYIYKLDELVSMVKAD